MLINESIYISRDSESIWSYWLDVTNDVHWRDGIIKAVWTSQPPYGIGSTGEHTHEKIGICNWKVTEFEDGRSFEFIHTAGGLKSSMAFFHVEPKNDGSHVQVQMRISGPFIMRVLMFFMASKMSKAVRGDLQKLKEIMEEQNSNA